MGISGERGIVLGGVAEVGGYVFVTECSQEEILFDGDLVLYYYCLC